MTRRNIPDPFDPIYMRRSAISGYSGIKSQGWKRMKSARPRTMLFDDFAFVLDELTTAGNIVRQFIKMREFQAVEFCPSIPWHLPLLNMEDAIQILHNLDSEADAIVPFWNAYAKGEYDLSYAVAEHYVSWELDWRPELDLSKVEAIDIPVLYAPFMSPEARLQHQYLLKLGGARPIPRLEPEPQLNDQEDDDIEIVEI